jgi:hypothetical protein
VYACIVLSPLLLAAAPGRLRPVIRHDRDQTGANVRISRNPNENQAFGHADGGSGKTRAERSRAVDCAISRTHAALYLCSHTSEHSYDGSLPWIGAAATPTGA